MLVVIMGVSGSGKSTIGQLLADRLGWPFLEADEFHPPENRRKLAAGTPLTDEDRWPWLEALNQGLITAVRRSGSLVLACSALKDEYRDRLDEDLPPIRWVHLMGDQKLLEERLQHRVGHFSSPQILPSQFETLEPPPDALKIRVDRSPAYVVEHTARGLCVAHVDPESTDRVIARHVLESPDFKTPAAVAQSEEFENVLKGSQFRLERIVSRGQITPEGEWLEQDQPEWVLLAAGSAKLRFDGVENPYDVAAGDAWLIPAGRRHRVEATDAHDPSVWVALHFRA